MLRFQSFLDSYTANLHVPHRNIVHEQRSSDRSSHRFLKQKNERLLSFRGTEVAKIIIRDNQKWLNDMNNRLEDVAQEIINEAGKMIEERIKQSLNINNVLNLGLKDDLSIAQLNLAKSCLIEEKLQNLKTYLLEPLNNCIKNNVKSELRHVKWVSNKINRLQPRKYSEELWVTGSDREFYKKLVENFGKGSKQILGVLKMIFHIFAALLQCSKKGVKRIPAVFQEIDREIKICSDVVFKNQAVTPPDQDSLIFSNNNDIHVKNLRKFHANDTGEKALITDIEKTCGEDFIESGSQRASKGLGDNDDGNYQNISAKRNHTKSSMRGFVSSEYPQYSEYSLS